MKKLDMTTWTDEQKNEFWEEWCSIGAYADDVESESPWGMPWTHSDILKVKDSDQTMRDFAKTYYDSVKNEIQICLEDEMIAKSAIDLSLYDLE